MRRRRTDITISGLTAVVLLCFSRIVVLAQPFEVDGQAVLEISMEQAVLMALTNNRALSVQILIPEIQKTFEDTERAVFDIAIAGEVGFEQADTLTNGLSGNTTRTIGGSVEVIRHFSTGTRLGVSLMTEQDSNGDKESAAQFGLAITQALLQGRPVAVNRAGLRQARLDTDISAYELRGFIEALVADVESAYWECALANLRMEILQKSLSLAEQQLQAVEQRIKVGGLPETEMAAARAEIALRREALINARSELSTTRLRLLRLIAPDMLRKPRGELRLTTEPVVSETDIGNTDLHVVHAIRNRPDMNQARLRIQSGDLELVKTRNGLLPRMDLFIEWGDTGYAESFGGSLSELDGKDSCFAAGVTVEFPLHNRADRAVHQRALFSREQMAESLKNMEDLVRVDVESACIEVERTREQVAATATTRRF
ncbi:MAG: TolC family protein, partial [Lentisphaerae bacterium]|nr:TolC family protein [Lentisphaerota bacterium]